MVPTHDTNGVVRISAFTGGVDVASARFRVRQMIGPLRQYNVDVAEKYPRAGSFPPPVGALFKPFVRPMWALASVSGRVLPALDSHRRDVTLLQREMLSGHVTLEGLTRSPRVLDVDDAIWLVRDGSAAERLARMCDLVICGNSFLADGFARWNRNIEILPTAVDVSRFQPSAAPKAGTKRVIGWSGGSAASHEIEGIEPALAAVLARHPDATLLIFAPTLPRLRQIPPGRLEFVKWSAEIEPATFQRMDIGLMPLPDTLWSRGKCSYKMLLYMACGIPVVVSPVGMNNDVLALGEVGSAARTVDEWTDALDSLISRPDDARRKGQCGREVVVQHFGVEQIAPRLATALRRVAATAAR